MLGEEHAGGLFADCVGHLWERGEGVGWSGLGMELVAVSVIVKAAVAISMSVCPLI